MASSFANMQNQKQQLLATTELQQWAVTKAEKNLAATKIYAPFDAYIHNANLEVGQYIGANSPIATLLDQQKIDVKFTLSDGQYGRIIAQDGTIIGRKIQAVWQIGQIEKVFDAVISRVNSEIIAASGGIDLYASIINVEAVEALRIGAFVKVLIPDQTYEQIIKIPDYMIYDNDVVYVVARLNPKVEETSEDGETAKAGETPKGDKKQVAGKRKRPEAGAKSANGQGKKDQGKRPEGAKKKRPNGGKKPEAAKPADDGKAKKPDDAKGTKTPGASDGGDAKTGNDNNGGNRGGFGGGKRGKNPDAELKENEKRLEPVKVQVVGYDGDQILIVNLLESENPLEAGDALLQTRLTLAGRGVLVITSEESAKRQAAALEKLKKNAENGEGNNNRRFGRRGNLFGGTGGRR